MLTHYDKAIVAALGLLAQVLTTVVQYGTDVIPENWLAVIQGVIAVITIVLTYLVPNKIVAVDPKAAVVNPLDDKK